MQSNLDGRADLHVAIIMDGNGRWASARGLPRTAGHRAGVSSVRTVVEAAPDLGIDTLTLFAFSADNWRRPQAEVGALMMMLRGFLRGEASRLARNGVRLSVIGRRDRLPDGLAAEIGKVETATAAGTRLHLRVALDYSARDAILCAAAATPGSAPPTRESFGRLLAGERGAAARDVDLVIRPGGEKRLSDFLLWESAYAELRFEERLWPDYDAADLAAALRDFRGRERRFGGLAPCGTSPDRPAADPAAA